VAEVPVVAVPEPETLVALTDGDEAEANGVLLQFENELRGSGVSDAQLFPIEAVAGLSAPQMHEQPVAEFPDGHGRLVGPMVEEGWRRGVSQEVKRVSGEGQRWAAIKEASLG